MVSLEILEMCNFSLIIASFFSLSNGVLKPELSMNATK